MMIYHLMIIKRILMALLQVKAGIGHHRRKPGENTAQPDGPTIFDGFEQLGLKLERRKLPRPVLVTGYKEPLSNN